MGKNTDHFDRMRAMFKDAGVDVCKQVEDENPSILDLLRGRRVCLLVDLMVGDRVEHRAGEEISIERFQYAFGGTVFEFRHAKTP